MHYIDNMYRVLSYVPTATLPDLLFICLFIYLLTRFYDADVYDKLRTFSLHVITHS